MAANYPLLNAYVLAKDEEANILRCVTCLRQAGLPVVVLDSGSSDRTRQIAMSIPGVKVRDYLYRTHAEAYNWITAELTPEDQWVLVLDADMQVSSELVREMQWLASVQDADAIVVPIRMCVEGVPLERGSLCPPKAIAFKGGRALFEPCGHGERLAKDVDVSHARHSILHDDRKPYRHYLLSQLRYAANLRNRAASDQLTRRDRLRVRSPLLAILVPLYSLLFRGGMLAGAPGLLYAIDRAVAELLQYREALAGRISQATDKTSPAPDRSTAKNAPRAAWPSLAERRDAKIAVHSANSGTLPTET